MWNIKPNEWYAYYSITNNTITYVTYTNGNFIENIFILV